MLMNVCWSSGDVGELLARHHDMRRDVRSGSRLDHDAVLVGDERPRAAAGLDREPVGVG